MINDKYPKICGHRQCTGHAVPATWVYISKKWGNSYYCTRHAQAKGCMDNPNIGTWVQLTPNQRPVSVKE